MKLDFACMVAVTMLLSLVVVVVDSEQQVLSLSRTKKLTPRIKCGLRKIKRRGLIVGGQETFPGNWPWHAAVYHVDQTNHKREYKCGGTLIRAGYLLTTASCVYHAKEKPEGAVIVELGQHNLVESFSRKIDAIVQNISVHEKYISGETMYDIAVLRLKQNVSFTNYVQPVCLPDSSESIGNYVGVRGTIVGWGFRAAGALSDKLQSAEVPIISYIDCLKSDRDFFARNIYDGMFCAGLVNGTAPCFGDAGGGMFFQDNRVWTLRGIISFTERVYGATGGCNTEQYFGLVNVAHFIPWIEETIARWNDSIRPPVSRVQQQQQQQQQQHRPW
ncbi:brachyurin-like [Sabethes cyaneus]|uniref:brachyurin-like n=1 Tax=Sabethes cyaneus TaxID=53552 RepID=UPI00237EDBD9|nr:brachyurin-like [Sabethes cyaneus]